MSLHPLSRAPSAASPSPSEHERLVASMAAGDLGALSALYDHYADRAFAVAWSIVGTASGAETALTDGTLDFWRRCTRDRPTFVSGGWLLCRVSAHALDDRRLGHGVPGRLSGLTATQCQVLALTCAGRMSRSDIATETGRSPRAVAQTMTEALVHLRGPAPARGLGATRSRRAGPPGPGAPAPRSRRPEGGSGR